MLRVDRLDAFYGKKQVLFAIDLELEEHCVGAVIGPNGAGKSTVLRAIFGLVAERRGATRFLIASRVRVSRSAGRAETWPVMEQEAQAGKL